MVLAWQLTGPGRALPPLEDALRLRDLLTADAQDAVSALVTRAQTLPTESTVRPTVRPVLGEASRRLGLPPAREPLAAARQAQNLARLVRALLRAHHLVAEEPDGSRRQLLRPTR